MTTIGNVVRQKRLSLGMTITELSDRTGVGSWCISNLEREKTQMRLSNLEAVCTALGLDLSEVIQHGRAFDTWRSK